METGANTDYYKKTAMFWTDMIAMMSSKPTTLSAVGPLRNLSSNLKKITNELTEENKEIVGFIEQHAENNNLQKKNISKRECPAAISKV